MSEKLTGAELPDRPAKCPTCGFESFVAIAGHRWCCGCGRLDSPDGDGFSIPAQTRNYAALRAAAEQCWPIIAAWGTHGRHRGRGRVVKEILHRVGLTVMCLGKTKDGDPRHPLYVKGDVMPQVYQES